MGSLVNRVAVVTGAGSGIGLATSRILAERGASVVIAERDVALGVQAAQSLTEAGLAAHFVQVDVSDPAAVDALAAEAIRIYGGIDILVNNVGVTIREPFESLTLEHWNSVLAVNLTSMMLCVKACLSSLRASPHPAIVNLSSVNAESTIRGMGAYPATKGAVNSLTRSLAVDLGPHIRVNAVAPGVILTEAWRAQMADVEAATAHRVRYIPRGRVGTPEDVARAIAFLASDDADFITGTVLTVDGGMSSKLYAD